RSWETIGTEVPMPAVEGLGWWDRTERPRWRAGACPGSVASEWLGWGRESVAVSPAAAAAPAAAAVAAAAAAGPAGAAVAAPAAAAAAAPGVAPAAAAAAAAAAAVFTG